MILIAAALLNLTNAFHWLTFAPIATRAADYFKIDTADVDWFGQVFFIAGEQRRLWSGGGAWWQLKVVAVGGGDG